MKYFGLILGALCSFSASAAFSQTPIDDEWDTARERAFTPEGALQVMRTAKDKRAPDGFRISYAPCGDDEPQCISNQAEMAIGLPYAYQGAYTAQRNLAFCLDNGCDGSIIPKPELSCAWRIVIAASGHPEVGSTDTMSLEDCLKRLKPSAVGVAKAQAAKIFRTVYKKNLSKEWQ